MLIAVVILARKVPIAYPASSVQRGFCVGCIDLRFVRTTNRFCEKLFGLNAFDSYKTPGPALSLGLSSSASSLLDPTGTLQPIESTFLDSFTLAAQISVSVNYPEILTIFEHEDCGYVRSFDPTKTPEELMANQKSNLITVKEQLSNNNDLRLSGINLFRDIRCYYLYLDGRIELIV